MAQYFQVLSQSDKPVNEEIRQFYPTNIVENQTVQYVIGANEQSFPGQQILVSSDQVMLVDGQPQQIIVDQSQVSFQNQQFVLQDANIEFQDASGQQQIFYMDDSNVQRVETMAEAQPTQPVVLNHQLQTSNIHSQLTAASASPLKTVINTQRPLTLNQLQQSPTVLVPQRQQVGQVPQARQPISVQHQRPTSTSQEKMPLTKQGTAPLKPRPDTPANRHKPPAMRVTSTSQELHPVKKFPPTVLNQCKPDTEKKKVPKMPAVKARPPIKAVRYSVSNSTQHTANNSVPSGSVRYPVTSRPPRPVHRGPPPQQAVIQRPVQPQQQQQQYVIHNPNYVIQPQTNVQPAQQVGYPAFETSSQLKQIIENIPMDEEYSDSIRMLVILSTGEQRLITFTLPKEQCTITEILDQVGLTIYADTSINCTQTFMKEIHYIVHVRYSSDPPFPSAPPLVTPVQSEPTPEIPENIPTVLPPSPEHQPPQQLAVESLPPKCLTPEPPKELPKLIPGKLAVCTHCGYLSEDFNKCMRCKRKLPEDVKSMNVADQIASATPKKVEGGKTPAEKKLALIKAANGTSSSNTSKATPQSPGITKKRVNRAKIVEQEPIILTLSSDEEEDQTKTMTTLKLNESHSSMMDEISQKEPTLSEFQLTDLNSKSFIKDESTNGVTVSIYCRTIRIGSYRFIPADHNILINANELIMRVPLPNSPQEMKTIKIDKSKIVKVLANFQKALPVIFYYVTPSMAVHIRNILNMDKASEFYFDPISKEEAFKRITILPEHFGEEAKSIFKQIYGKPQMILEELNAKEANTILVKTCPKEITKSLQSTNSFTEIKQLLIYPPGKGGLSINTEDYLCLAQDQFLNDVIIDFYLKYLVLQLPQEQQDKIHVFSTFFYKRLTTKPSKSSRRMNPSETDTSLTAAQKRHSRVKKWTKNVNIFDKDYIVIPINESCHWFLAIICFPTLEGSCTLDGKPYKLEPKQKQPVKKKISLGGVTLTQLKLEKEEATSCDAEASDKDEAEGDESELESEEDTEDSKSGGVPPVKQPCILIFDSLAVGASRSRVVATLRDYLTCEYRTKMNEEKIFNKDNMKCSCPKVPQQTNFTDCGLYLLQYVESFFKNPIVSYQFPIKELKTWFEEITVTKKREDIARLIEDLMIDYGKDPAMLPEIQLPTLNGKLIIKSEEEFEDEENEEEEELMDEDFSSESPLKTDESALEKIENESDEYRQSQSSSDTSVNLTPKILNTLKSETTETKRTSNRETLSYLKAKRIIRHKTSESSDAKKFKATDDI